MIGGRIKLDRRDVTRLLGMWSARHHSWVDGLYAGSWTRSRVDVSVDEFCRLLPELCSVTWHPMQPDRVRAGVCIEDLTEKRDLFFFVEMSEVEFFSSLSG